VGGQKSGKRGGRDIELTSAGGGKSKSENYEGVPFLYEGKKKKLKRGRGNSRDCVKPATGLAHKGIDRCRKNRVMPNRMLSA